jgi:hypothetical protein
VDRDDHREGLAQRWLRGSGLEIGALHKPVQLARGVKVTYVDYKTADENRLRYPELAGQSLVQTDLIDDGFTLDKVADASQDFIIANHALEHSPDLCGTVECWLSKLRRGGILYFALPIAERCYDRGRPLTTLEHLRRDHDDFVLCNIERVIATTAAHIDEFIRISDRNIRIDSGMPPAEPAQIATLRDQLIDGLTKQIAGTALDHRSLIQAHVLGINKVYDVHYHTFSPSSLYGIMNALSGELGFTIAEYCKSGGGEVIAVLRKS